MWAGIAGEKIELKTKLPLVFVKFESQMQIVPTKPIRLNYLGCYPLIFNVKNGIAKYVTVSMVCLKNCGCFTGSSVTTTTTKPFF